MGMGRAAQIEIIECPHAASRRSFVAELDAYAITVGPKKGLPLPLLELLGWGSGAVCRNDDFCGENPQNEVSRFAVNIAKLPELLRTGQ